MATICPPTRVVKPLVSDIRLDPSQVPREPGIYIFSNRESCLYVGEAWDLYQRVVQVHCYHSDRRELAIHLWQNSPEDVHVELRIYDRNKINKKILAALEREFIVTRMPKFNIQHTSRPKRRQAPPTP